MSHGILLPSVAISKGPCIFAVLGSTVERALELQQSQDFALSINTIYEKVAFQGQMDRNYVPLQPLRCVADGSFVPLTLADPIPPTGTGATGASGAQEATDRCPSPATSAVGRRSEYDDLT